MNIKKFNESVRNDYIQGLIEFSGGAISHEEASKIAMRTFRPSDYYDGSGIIHKGPLYQAKEYVRH